MNHRDPLRELHGLLKLGLEPPPAVAAAGFAAVEALRHLERQMAAAFWSTEHFGRGDDGLPWVSDEFVQWVGEGKIDTTKNERVQREYTHPRTGTKFKRWVWVRKADLTPKEKPKKADPAEVTAAVKAQLSGDPAKLTRGAVAKMKAALESLTVEQIRAIKRDHDVKGGRKKAEQIDALLKRARELKRKADAAKKAAPAGTGSEPPPAKLSGPPAEPKNVTYNSDDWTPEARAVAERIVGTDVLKKPGLVGALTNAFDGGRVRVEYDDGRYNGQSELMLSMTAPGVHASRTLYRNGDDKLVMANESFEVEKDKPGKDGKPINPNVPKGADLLANQVKALKSIGVDYIKTYAAGTPESAARGDYVGFKVWPKLGYNGTIARDLLDAMPADLKAHMGTDADILKLYEHPDGEKWWSENGRGMNMKFDLADGSKSMKALEKYFAARDAKAKAKVTK